MVDWVDAPDIKKKVVELADELKLTWLKPENITCFRSYNASTRAYARIWGLPRIWQLALSQDPYYVIEVVSEKFDKQSPRKQEEILLHEICHIPRNFSGALVPHTKRGKGNFHERLHTLIQMNNSRR